jgi:hypothetical protein
MTAIEDENHHVLVRNTYNQNVVVRQDFGNGDVYSYRYTFAPGGFYAETVNVTLPNGSTTQVEADSSVSDAVKHPPS